MTKTVNVMFVCLGNICRSPAAEGVLKNLAQNEKDLIFQVKSCGVGDWHIGKLPDQRMREASQARGIELTSKAQLFQKKFFEQYDYILVADKEVLQFLYPYADKPEFKAKLMLMTEFSSVYKGKEIPDPYYQVGGAFNFVLDMLEDSCIGLIKHVKEKINSENSV
ncbi:MAG: low molecular weight phosphotyrosine protein phosphatase [Candidatus Protochlamydia sp.]|nr:low molecular weight phosphotyrosine protein phosphatase [Candidatus Protochlamydia sp.]